MDFQNRPRAEANLERICSRVHRDVARVIPLLLADLPDPDSALNYFERLTQPEDKASLQLFHEYPSVINYVLTVFSYSSFLGETLIRNTDLLHRLAHEESFDRSYRKDEFRAAFARFRESLLPQISANRGSKPRSPNLSDRNVRLTPGAPNDSDLAELLARFKRREYVRIMLRDVLGLAELAEITDEISCLSDVLIEEAVREAEALLRSRYGVPQRVNRVGKGTEPKLSVLALGKLGGNELNYSSDVDLMFLYEGSNTGDPSDSSAHEYFVKLGQDVTEILSRVTKEGFAFRIDLRLRPQGREGESAVSLQNAVRYYRDHAHGWERQAMIKARHCAGNASLSRRFLQKIAAEAYTEDVNFAAIETALRTRDQISARRKSPVQRDDEIDVKLDRGGIRDIEFLVQCMQRIYGGKETWLRSRGTLFALQKLHDKEHISGQDFQTLTATYEFLRNVEHRLQLRHGRQTHRVPAEPTDLRILARSMKMQPTQLMENLKERMSVVGEIYDRIIHHQQQQTTEQVEEAFALRTLDVSFGRVHSEHQILQRVSAESEELYRIASSTDLEPHTRRNLFRFLSGAFTSAERFRVVVGAPGMVEKALQIFELSEYLTDSLVRHPEDISSLAYLRASTPRHQPVLFSDEHPIRSGVSPALFAYMARNDIERADKLALMRRRFRHQMFLSGARDVIEARPVSASFVDSTAAANEAISVAFAVAGVPRDFAILALGRLGSCEFDCLSDADLLFIRSESSDIKAAALVAETVVSALSSYTREGTVMPVDLRLRPHGNEGEVTITPGILRKYAATEAQSWESLTYSKLRYLAGDSGLAAEAIAAVNVAGARFAANDRFAADVKDMRCKLEVSADSDNMRTAPGGMYDIDFLVSFLIVKHGVQTAIGNTRERLQQLRRAGLIAGSDLQTLLDAAEFFRTTEHCVRLVTGHALKGLPISETTRKSVETLVSRILAIEPSQQLKQMFLETTNRVRDIYERKIV